MLYRRSAYEEIGGYESMRYSLNEDFQIFHEFCVKRSHGFKYIMTPNSTNLSTPIESYLGVIRQRYRWTRGAKHVPKMNLVAFAIPCLTGILILVSLLINWQFALMLLSLKLISEALLRSVNSKQMNQPSKLWFLPLWHFTTISTGVLIPFCLFFSKKITWKGRKI